jgi:hypothetical protein
MKAATETGCFEVTPDGRVSVSGDAVFAGTIARKHLPSKIVGIVAHPKGGYILTAATGEKYAFGGAPYERKS